MKHFALWAIGFASAETQTSEAERACLARFAVGRKRLAEIGVWHGVTTCCLRRAMASDAVLLCIDPYPVGRLGFSAQQIIANREVSRIRNGRVEWIRATGAEAGREHRLSNRAPMDFVFIDGDHTYEGLREDWEAWSPLVTDNGIVALHDSCSSRDRQIDDAGSVIFTNEVIRNDPDFEVAEVADTLTVLRKRA